MASEAAVRKTFVSTDKRLFWGLEVEALHQTKMLEVGGWWEVECRNCEEFSMTELNGM
jgi:hypothetical protein